ncbi:MAG: gamma-glutamyl-phosphate reductase, partial [Bacteroidales bacterium]|nr:gamma-glutamyl-phosphate reductase [Bacteroidales bacterium]
MKVQEQLQNALIASRKLIMLEGEMVKEILIELAKQTRANTDFILQENKKDLERMDSKDPNYDRLKLTPDRIDGIAGDIENVASLPNPIGNTLKKELRPNGLKVRKTTVPFGLIGVIYEARPNVTLDVFALCFKSGNACVLKGGSDAIYSNTAIVSIIKKVLNQFELDVNTVSLLSTDREDTNEMLKAREYIDLIIPRGSQGLIDFVRKNSTIPVIETGVGVCHTYFDELGDIEKGRE